MTRSIARGALPTLPGEWLRCFRQRTRDSDGHGCSLEELGRVLGVSWRTIHRWETGSSQPGSDDLRTMARYFGLTPFQTNFLFRAFVNRRAGMAPVMPNFIERATTLLRSAFPAYLVDDLFYVRGWNSYASALGIEFECLSANRHLVSSILGTEGAADRLRYWAQTLWSETAGFCGLGGYQQMLHELTEIRGFDEAWMTATLEPDTEPSMLGAPESIDGPGGTEYRVYSSRIYMPPFYYLREYVPMNARASAALDQLRVRASTVHLESQIHWTQPYRRSVP